MAPSFGEWPSHTGSLAAWLRLQSLDHAHFDRLRAGFTLRPRLPAGWLGGCAVVHGEAYESDPPGAVANRAASTAVGVGSDGNSESEGCPYGERDKRRQQLRSCGSTLVISHCAPHFSAVAMVS